MQEDSNIERFRGLRALKENWNFWSELSESCHSLLERSLHFWLSLSLSFFYCFVETFEWGLSRSHENRLYGSIWIFASSKNHINTKDSYSFHNLLNNFNEEFPFQEASNFQHESDFFLGLIAIPLASFDSLLQHTSWYGGKRLDPPWWKWCPCRLNNFWGLHWPNILHDIDDDDSGLRRL